MEAVTRAGLGVHRADGRPRTNQRSAHIEENGPHDAALHCNTNSLSRKPDIVPKPRRAIASPTRNNEPVMTMTSGSYPLARANASTTLWLVWTSDSWVEMRREAARCSVSVVLSLLPGTPDTRFASAVRLSHHFR